MAFPPTEYHHLPGATCSFLSLVIAPHRHSM